MAQGTTSDQMKADRGARLEAFRLWLDATQQEMAEWVYGEGASRTNISAAERAARPIPAERLVELFGVSYEWLMGWSDDWWGPRVHALRKHLDQWVRELTPEQNAQLMHPGSRIAASYKEITRVSTLVTEQYAAAIVGIKHAKFRALLEAKTFATDSHWERWAGWTDLPSGWLAKGLKPDPDLRSGEVAPYLNAVGQAIQMNVSPEKLLNLVKVVAE
jgi:hypothetical protein